MLLKNVKKTCWVFCFFPLALHLSLLRCDKVWMKFYVFHLLLSKKGITRGSLQFAIEYFVVLSKHLIFFWNKNMCVSINFVLLKLILFYQFYLLKCSWIISPSQNLLLKSHNFSIEVPYFGQRGLSISLYIERVIYVRSLNARAPVGGS